jgi:hypothetical protein
VLFYGKIRLVCEGFGWLGLKINAHTQIILIEWQNYGTMDKKRKIYFETIVCMILGTALLSIATYFSSLPREVQLAPNIVVMIDYISVGWMYFVAMALFIIAVVRVQRYRTEKIIKFWSRS